MKKLYLILVFILIPAVLAAQNINILTVAEKTEYKETSRYKDVISFVKALQKGSDLVDYKYIGKSAENKLIPLMIIGKECFRNPIRARSNGMLVIYIQANIHAGEVEGKEASLMLIRDLINSKRDIFENVVLLVTPIYNIDGNEKISTQNRRNQVGPEGGVGIRYNGQNLDLNRDAIKLEAYETQALLREVFNIWDPHIFVDCHTTNGTKHRYQLTFAGPSNPNCNPDLYDYVHNNFLQEIMKRVKKNYDHDFFYYGNLRRDRDTGEYSWFTTPVE